MHSLALRACKDRDPIPGFGERIAQHQEARARDYPEIPPPACRAGPWFGPRLRAWAWAWAWAKWCPGPVGCRFAAFAACFRARTLTRCRPIPRAMTTTPSGMAKL